MKKDFKSTLLLVVVIVAVVVLGKIALDMYHSGKFEWKHKDGETKVKFARHEYNDYE